MLPIVHRITRAGRSPLFHPVRISYQQGRGRSTIAKSEKGFGLKFRCRVLRCTMSSLIHSREFRRATSSIFPPFFSPSATSSYRAAFCKPSWKTNADVTPLCGVPPAVGVTSGEGAERRKPIVASTRPNHLRFCGQAIHVPSSFSWYSLTAHRDRDETRYRTARTPQSAT